MTWEREKGNVLGWSYKTFMACKPPEFAGITEPVRCIYWIKEMEIAFEANECDVN